MEKVVYKQLVKYLEFINFFHTSQHGFLRSRCTTTAIIPLVNKILKEWENKINVTVIFIDHQKAFDCIDRKILLAKLKGLGVEGVDLEWIIHYFKDRTQVREQ